MSAVKAKKRGFIRFQQKGNRPILTREQCDYWMELLPKILKIGTEFEINLPDPSQILQGKNDAPCIHSHKSCIKDCANVEDCLVERHPTFCLTKHTSQFLGEPFKCPAKSDSDAAACKGCSAWLLNCRGFNCASYTPFCTVCPAFERVGEVIEGANIRRDAESIRREVRDLLQPTNFVGQVGRHGVLEVKKDNSLINNGGIEVPTVGRRIHWNSFHSMCKGIVEPIVARGGFVNERSGQHFHILAGYFKDSKINEVISELEEPLPEIVLANLHQLHRRYELAMFWLTSAGTDSQSITRWARFRQSIFKFSAMSSRMGRVQEELAEHILSMNNNQRGKYASVAYHFCEFNPEGDVSTFHIENRIADGCLSPSVVTAWAMLFYALVLKAVRLSQYGIMEVGSNEYIEKAKEIQPHLIDGEKREWGENRKADTSRLVLHIGWLRESAREMINFLKPELHGLGPAYDILMSLAEKPCSIRLISGDSWEKIESDFLEEFSGRKGRGIEDELRETIDLAGIVDCGSLTTWVEEVAANIGQPTNVVLEIVSRMIRSGHYRWSEPIGALITS